MMEYRKDSQHSDRDHRGNCRYFDTSLDGIEIFRHLIQRIRAGMTLDPSLSYGTDLLFPLSKLDVHPRLNVDGSWNWMPKSLLEPLLQLLLPRRPQCIWHLRSWLHSGAFHKTTFANEFFWCGCRCRLPDADARTCRYADLESNLRRNFFIS